MGTNNNTMHFAVGAIAVVAVLLLVGYIMNTKQGNPEIAQSPTQSAPQVQGDATTMALASQSSSDNLTSINADLQATDMNSLNDIDKI